MPNGSEVEGVDGIMAAYASALHNVALAGPTLFGPVINMAAEIAVGGADFTQMEILDADNGRLVSSTGRVATRDIVQFVPIRDVHSGRISAVQALLEELHGQFLSYVRAGDIKPRNLQVA
ncbi:hypothetical protein Q3G72_002988 [Acer saccharum]|nr:hypothetical protein Q3G72_002988 [Acer saccharum]